VTVVVDEVGRVCGAPSPHKLLERGTLQVVALTGAELVPRDRFL
jgi:hypothetical protein